MGSNSVVSKLPACTRHQIYSRPSIATSIGVDISSKQVKPLNPESHVGHVTGTWADVCKFTLCVGFLYY